MGFRHCKDYVAYVWAKHEDVDGNIYQVLKGRGRVGGSPCGPWAQDLAWSVFEADPNLGLCPGPIR